MLAHPRPTPPRASRRHVLRTRWHIEGVGCRANRDAPMLARRWGSSRASQAPRSRRLRERNDLQPDTRAPSLTASYGRAVGDQTSNFSMDDVLASQQTPLTAFRLGQHRGRAPCAYTARGVAVPNRHVRPDTPQTGEYLGCRYNQHIHDFTLIAYALPVTLWYSSLARTSRGDRDMLPAPTDDGRLALSHVAYGKEGISQHKRTGAIVMLRAGGRQYLPLYDDIRLHSQEIR